MSEDKKNTNNEFFDDYDDAIDPGFLEQTKKLQKPKGTLKVTLSSSPAPAELTEEQMFEVMKDYIRGETQVKLAEKYGVSQSRISRLLHGHVDSNRYTFDPSSGDRKPAAGNELLFRALKLAISMRKEAESALVDQIVTDELGKKLAEKTRKLKLERNENNRLRKRVKSLEERLRKAKNNKK